jgi:hypothetical protein
VNADTLLMLIVGGAYLLLALLFGLWARSKNRNILFWGVLWPFHFFISGLLMSQLPALCPKCRKPITEADRKAKTCPTCTLGR